MDAAKWQQIFEVYVEDRYGRDIKKFFNAHNSWAYQSMTARMLEAIRKDYWQADERITRKLAVEYALNVVEKGVACCHHTCNNPLLNQMVVNIISFPGVLSSEMVEKFKMAIEKMAQKSLEMQIVDRKELVVKLNDRLDKMNRNAPQEERKTSADQELSEESPKTSSEAVEGYKMEDMDVRDDTTVLSSSGIQWAASLFVLLVMGLFFWGMRRRR